MLDRGENTDLRDTRHDPSEGIFALWFEPELLECGRQYEEINQDNAHNCLIDTNDLEKYDQENSEKEGEDIESSDSNLRYRDPSEYCTNQETEGTDKNRNTRKKRSSTLYQEIAIRESK